MADLLAEATLVASGDDRVAVEVRGDELAIRLCAELTVALPVEEARDWAFKVLMAVRGATDG